MTAVQNNVSLKFVTLSLLSWEIKTVQRSSGNKHEIYPFKYPFANIQEPLLKLGIHTFLELSL